MNAELEQGSEGGEASGLIAAIPRILWERKWFIVGPMVLGLLIGIAAAFLIKPSYQAKAMMLVESQDLPGQNQFDDGDSIDRRMAKIREQILSRPDLVELIQTYNLYDAASHSQSLSTLVDKVRDGTSLSAISGGVKSRAGNTQSAIAFALTFSYPKPNLAQSVAQSFVDRLLKLDAESRVNEAQNNVNILENQQETLQGQLGELEAELQHLTGTNGMILSSSLGLAMGGDGGNYAAQIAALQQQNNNLRMQMGTWAVERNASVVAAEAALATAREQYSDNHPDVKLAEKRLDAMRSTATSVQDKGTSAAANQQIATNNAMIAQLTSGLSAQRVRAQQMAAAQSKGPEIQQQVGQLQARAGQIRENLGRVTNQLLNARTSAQLAAEQRGQRLALIDPPVTPDTPTSPNRPMLILTGLGAGLAIGLLLAAGLELLLRPIRGVGMLTGIVGVPPLSVVPRLKHTRS